MSIDINIVMQIDKWSLTQGRWLKNEELNWKLVGACRSAPKVTAIVLYFNTQLTLTPLLAEIMNSIWGKMEEKDKWTSQLPKALLVSVRAYIPWF